MDRRPGSSFLHAAAAVLTGLSAWNGCPGAALAEAPRLRAEIIATYLVKFAPFVEWPPGSFAAPTAPLVICVVDDPLGRAIDEAATGQIENQHPVAVHHIASAGPDTPCHILFTEGTPQQPVGKGLAAVKGKPVLTVSDQPASAADKGIINFVVQDNHVRFEIDQEQAAQAGLRLSSQLLALAVNVQRR